MAVTENERKYDELKTENTVKEKRVRDLQIANMNKK